MILFNYLLKIVLLVNLFCVLSGSMQQLGSSMTVVPPASSFPCVLHVYSCGMFIVVVFMIVFMHLVSKIGDVRYFLI